MEALHDKVALVTGASSGIGLACVARFVREGARVVGLDVTEPHDDLDLPVGTREVSFVQADVRDETAIETAVGAAVGEQGRHDAVVTAAGVAGGGPAHLVERDEW
jgi:NAD(P)-dependent dehydrogenase (short-subunit alcohol dehydrogenase family)